MGKLVRAQDRAVYIEFSAKLCNEWLQHERQQGAAEMTIATYRRSLDVFTRWVQENAPGLLVTPAVVQAFKDDLASKYSAQTVNLRMVACRRFYDWAVIVGLAPLNPAAPVRGVRRRQSRLHKRDALTASEVRALLDACDISTPAGARDRALLGLMAFCGLRQIEIHRLNVGDVKARQGRVTCAVTGKGHNDADAVAIVPKDEEQHLRRWLAVRFAMGDHSPDAPLFCSLSDRSRGERLSLRAIRHLVKNRFRALGILEPTKTTHSLRHSAIQAAALGAARAGRSIRDVQGFSRHASLETVGVYLAELDRFDRPVEDLITYEGD